MTRRRRIISIIGVGLAALIVLLGATTFFIVQTDWFRQFVRQKIITATEDATGGRVEVGSFAFDPAHLRAVITNFVIHGKEPADAAPFVTAARVQLDIRLFTSIKHILDLAYLGVEKPAVNLISFPDGTTNLPTPKKKTSSDNNTVLQTIVNLAVDRFYLFDGVITANARKQEFDLRGNNLRADLGFNPLLQTYSGQLAMEPLYVVAGRKSPVTFRIVLPVTLEKDRVDVKNATVTTPDSTISLNGYLENLKQPHISAHLNGDVSLADLGNAANLPIYPAGPNVPRRIAIDLNAAASNDVIDVTGARIGLGQSTLEASGRLRGMQSQGPFQFRASLSLGELGRLARVAARPEGSLELNGQASLDSASNVDLNGNLQTKNLSFVQGTQRIRNLDIQSALHLDGHTLQLQGLRLAALGGEFLGNVSLRDFHSYEVDGNLRNLDIRTAARTFGQQSLPYAGIVSGPIHISGDTQQSSANALTARTNLTIRPGRTGIPVSGRLDADYDSATGAVRIGNSYVDLPHTRLGLQGSLNNRVAITLNSRDLSDLLAAVPSSGSVPVRLNGGQASFNGAVTGSLQNPVIAGHLQMSSFSVSGREFQMLAADLSASASGASVRAGSLTRGDMNAEFSGSTGLRGWHALPNEPVQAEVSVRGGDVADVIVLAGQPAAGYSGALSATAHIQGTVGNPRGNADVQVSAGNLYGEPFDRAEVHVNLDDRLITVPAAYISSGARRVDLSAEFHHPSDSLTAGQVHAHVKSNQVDLAALQVLQRQRPNTGGVLQLDADVTGELTAGEGSPQFLLKQVAANASASRLRFDGQTYGDLTFSASTSGQTVSYRLRSDFAGSDSQIDGQTQLIRDYPTKADASISHLPIERLLALAKQTNIPARGSLSGTAHFAGSTADPQGSIDLDLANAVVYDEPLDHVRARVSYLPTAVEIAQLQVTQGAARIDLSGRFDHPRDDFSSGNWQVKVDSTGIDLARVRNLQKLRSGLGGQFRIAASGGGALHPTEPRINLSSFNADIEAANLSVQRSSLGNIAIKANSSGAGAGNRVTFALDSNLAGSAIHGQGSAQLNAEYPVDARVTFENLDYNRIRNAMGSADAATPAFDAATDGFIALSGPLTKADQLQGTLQLTKISLEAIARPGMPRPVSIRNQDPVRLTMQNGVVQIESAHLTGPQTDVQATGTISLPQQTLNVNLNATANLALLQSLSRDIVSSGAVAASASMRGNFSKPQIIGQLDLKNASVNHTSIPNGIENANGTILFNGSNATIRNFKAETGGGTLTASGFVGYADDIRMGLRAQASNVRYRVQQGVSAVASADIRLTGTTTSSVVSGNVTVEQLNYAPQSDIGAILSRSSTPVQSDSTPSPILDNMKLDIRVQTSPALGVQASVAQNLQASADLRVRGTAAQPGVLGRVTISEGQLVFFGSVYTVNSGVIGFYDPLRILPVLNVNLETQAKGVDVVLTVTGPIDNMKLTYTSDPPLQFQEIIGLLAAGKTPTSDPTLLANQPSQPAQSYEQMGESAIVSKALADPLANRLQRVFGITQLKIDPAFTSGSQLPTARLTFQQQITSHVTFTYTSALDDPNSTIIRAEWSFNPQYSAVATRDQNGLVSVLLYYKKQFR